MIRMLSVFAAGTVLLGCADSNVTRSTAAVAPITVGDTARVSAHDMALALLRAGFTAQEVLDHGPGIRNALSTRGGVQVRREGNVFAVISVLDNELYIVSQSGGTYVHRFSPA